MNRLTLLLVLFVVLTSCTKTTVDPSQEVEVLFNYVLPESGSMTRATAAEVYDTFYEKFIKTGELLPTPYTLSFKTMDGKEVASISGNWKNNKPVTLSTGKYQVSGFSKGNIVLPFFRQVPSCC